MSCSDMLAFQLSCLIMTDRPGGIVHVQCTLAKPDLHVSVCVCVCV